MCLEYLDLLDWDSLLLGNHIDDDWNAFHIIVVDLINKCAPLRGNRNFKPKPPSKFLKAKLKTWAKYVHSKLGTDKAAFQQASKGYVTAVRNRSKIRESNIINSNCHTLCKIQTSMFRAIPPLELDGVVLSTEHDKAETFNRSFQDAFMVDNDILPEFNPPIKFYILEGNLFFYPRRVF